MRGWSVGDAAALRCAGDIDDPERLFVSVSVLFIFSSPSRACQHRSIIWGEISSRFFSSPFLSSPPPSLRLISIT